MSANLAPGLCDGVFLVDCVERNSYFLISPQLTMSLRPYGLEMVLEVCTQSFVHDRTCTT